MCVRLFSWLKPSQAVSYQRVVFLHEDIMQYQTLQGSEYTGEILSFYLYFIMCVRTHISIFVAVSLSIYLHISISTYICICIMYIYFYKYS